MKIINYKAIECLDFNLKRFNIIYGLNGVGKTTIKSILYKKTNNINIEHIKNINHNEQETIIEVEEIDTHKSIIFDENFVREMVYKDNNLVGSNKYNVLFSKDELNDLKNDTASITTFLNSAYKTLESLTEKLFIPVSNVKDYIVDGKITSKLKNLTRPMISNSSGKDKLESLKENSDLYQWWFEGFSKFWKKEENTCIFCHQDIANSEFNTVLKNKTDEKQINLKTQNELLDKVKSLDSILSDELKVVNNEFKNLIVDSFHSNVDSRLVEIKDKLLPIKQLLETVNSKKDRISKYLYNFNQLSTLDLKVTMNTNLLNQDNIALLNKYNDLVDDIEEKLNEYNQKLIDSNNKLVKLIEDNKIAFNNILSCFNLKYRIDLTSLDLDLIKENLNYSFDLVSNDNNNKIDIINKTNEIVSYGERNTISFTFFMLDLINKLKNRKSGEKFLIVLDDPISSHDIFRKYSTVDIIKKYIINELTADDIFILFTHEFELMLPMYESIRKPLHDLDKNCYNFVGLRASNNKIESIDITTKNLKNTISRCKTYISNSKVHYISKAIMYRIIREFDLSVVGGNMNNDNIISFFSSVIHSRNDLLTLDESVFSDFIKKYSLMDYAKRSLAEYQKMFSEIDLNSLQDIDKYFIMRPYIEYLLSLENFKLEDETFVNYSNKKVVDFIVENFTFLNSSVHNNRNEDEPTIYDIKELEMFSGTLFEKFLKALK